MKFKPLLIIAFFFLLSGCTTKDQVYLTTRTKLSLLDLKPTFVASEQLYQFNNVGEGNTETLSLILSVRTDSTSLQVIGLTPTGNRLFLIHGSHDQLEIDKESYFPKSFPLKYLYADLLLIFSNEQELSNVLSSYNLKLKSVDSPNYMRKIYSETEIMKIRYTSEKIFESDIELNNVYRNYSFTLKRLS